MSPHTIIAIILISQVILMSEVSSDSNVDIVQPDTYATPHISNDQYNPPGQSYQAPASDIGNTPAAGSGFAPATNTAPDTNSKKPFKNYESDHKKFNLISVLAAFKLMVLYILFVLYKLTYLTEYPNYALSIDQQRRRDLDEDLGSVTYKFVIQMLEGDYDVNKLFEGRRRHYKN